MPTDGELAGGFEGTWESQWVNVLNLATLVPANQLGTGKGIECFLNFGVNFNDGKPMVIGRGNNGSPNLPVPPLLVAGNQSWTYVFRLVNNGRGLIGRWHSGPWIPEGERVVLPEGSDFMPVSFATSNRVSYAGQVFFNLSDDGWFFTGGWNSSADPDNWRPWDGRKVSDDPRHKRDVTWPEVGDVDGWPRNLFTLTRMDVPSELL
jgi:hypothetical protein